MNMQHIHMRSQADNTELERKLHCRNRGQKWKLISALKQASWAIPQDALPWTGRANVHMHGINLSHRQLVLTNMCFAIERAKMTAASQKNTATDGTRFQVDTRKLFEDLWLDES